MESPVNAAYGKKDVPENPGEKTKIFGMVFRKEEMWKVGLVIGAVLVVTLFFIIFLMPTGISFLAAKNASGLLGYMGLFTGYMFGFVFVIAGFFAAVVGILYLIQKYA
jgi:ABC-type branched-subunit amino acid transport system permease subunit